MTLQIGSRMTKRLKIICGEKAAFGQNAIIGWRRMPFREHKTVALFHIGVRRINFHLRKIQIREDVRHRKRAAWMAGFRRMDSFDNIFTHTIRRLPQFQKIHVQSRLFTPRKRLHNPCETSRCPVPSKDARSFVPALYKVP